MLAHRYHVWPNGWGNEWDADSDAEIRYVGITAVAKRDRESPYEVFNELVAMRLGNLLGLSVPVGLVVEREGHPYYCSCHLHSSGGSELPPADFNRFSTEQPNWCCGVVVFDAWIANSDRHDENMWYDYYAGEYAIIDHGRGLLNGSGRIHLNSNKDRLAVRVDQPCLSAHIRSFNDFAHWYDRICDLPATAIFSATKEAAKVGIDEQLARECAEWLIKRRIVLPDLFRSEMAAFPRVEPSVLDPFGRSDDYSPEYCI